MNRNLDGLFRRALHRPFIGPPPGLEGDFAVVDCARNPRIHTAVTNSRAESACLYNGILSSDLARVSPHIVRLERGSSFVREFYTGGWNDAWGIVLRTTADLISVRRHLRTLAYVRDASGLKLLFRYYDPRVLRAFLPTCDETQLDQLFGPISAFVLDGTHGAPPQVVSRRPGGGLAWAAPGSHEERPA